MTDIENFCSYTVKQLPDKMILFKVKSITEL
jgi:hypothetical protein